MKLTIQIVLSIVQPQESYYPLLAFEGSQLTGTLPYLQGFFLVNSTKEYHGCKFTQLKTGKQFQNSSDGDQEGETTLMYLRMPVPHPTSMTTTFFNKVGFATMASR